MKATSTCTLAILAWSTFLTADTIVLRDGRTATGELIAVQNGVIEFDAFQAFGGRERVRINRGDVARIDFDSNNGGTLRQPENVRTDQRPSGLRERDVTVESTRPWTDTGIDVRSGQGVFFVATGRVRWGPGRQDGPEGEQNSPYNANRPIPSRPAAALIGKVGEGKDNFFIGNDRGRIPVRSSGRLYLGVNDDVLGDNGGSFRVTVYY
jgi:hypothetical protein